MPSSPRRTALPTARPIEATPPPTPHHEPHRPATPDPARKSRVATRWIALRSLSLVALLSMCVTLIIDPSDGLFVFWRLLVPTLPLLFFVATGVWRNICPISAANQLPRVLGITRAIAPPRVLREYGYVVAITMLLVIIPTRRVVFDHSGPATAALLLGVMFAAFVGGAVFSGKSGWCSSICPMLPIERFYGQTPFAVVRNNHCNPCVGCANHCYDADPVTASGSDMRDPAGRWRRPRRLFAAAFPGLIAAYFLLPALSTPMTYLGFAAAAAASIAVCSALALATRRWYTVHTSIAAAITINGFYFLGLPSFMTAAERYTYDRHLDAAIWPFRAALAMATVWWLARTFDRDRARGTAPAAAAAVPVSLSGRTATPTPAAATSAPPEGVRFADHDAEVRPPAGTSLLEAAERCGVALAGSCRVGMCGADPISVLDGAEHLGDLGDEEAKTLQRLGLPSHVRMACSARLLGSGGVCVSTDLADVPDGANDEEPELAAAAAVRSVVIIGNGVAGVTMAEEVRKLNAGCEIHLIGREAFPFYNRMAISRVVHERLALNGLAMKPGGWYDDERITCWINTQVRKINRGKRTVELATGDVLAWDRLFLATGSRSNLPTIPGRGLPGVFVLREATDAIALRAYVQARGARHAAVVGGGLLGLEAAHALHKLGLATTVLEGGPRLLQRFLDETGSAVLAEHFAREGIAVRCNASVEAFVGEAEVEHVHIGVEGHLRAEVVVVCAGITPNIELARAAGIATNRGVLVDPSMRTSAAGIYAAGDVAEFDGAIVGLWATAGEQAAVAVRSAFGGDAVYEPQPPAAVLKGAGIELTSVGRTVVEPDDAVLRWVGPAGGAYTLVVIDRTGDLAGAVLIGQPGPARLAVASMQGDRDPAALLDALLDQAADQDAWSWPAPWPPPMAHTTRPRRTTHAADRDQADTSGGHLQRPRQGSNLRRTV